MSASLPVASDKPEEQQKPQIAVERQTARGAWGGFWGSLSRNPKVIIGLCIVAFFFLVAILGPLFIHGDPNALTADALEPPSATHLLGTTQTGQDIFGELLQGTRVSLFLGFAIGTLSTIISIIVGLTAGYVGGLADDILSLFTNVFLVMPVFALSIVLASYFPFKGPIQLAFIITVTSWSWGARVLRAQTLSMRSRDFVEAAKASGESTLRIIFFEILPNEIAIVVAGFIGTVTFAILAEIGLEFLGLGDITVMSWGVMLYWAQNNDALLLGAWWWFLPPGLCTALLCAGLAFINNGIDEIANPRLRREAKPKQIKSRKAVA